MPDVRSSFDYELDLADLFHSEAYDFRHKQSEIVARIRDAEFYSRNSMLEPLVDMLAEAPNAGEFNLMWLQFLDWCSSTRVEVVCLDEDEPGNCWELLTPPDQVNDAIEFALHIVASRFPGPVAHVVVDRLMDLQRTVAFVATALTTSPHRPVSRSTARQVVEAEMLARAVLAVPATAA